MALTLRLFLGENMIEVGLGAFEATFARFLEALGRAPVRFHLRHLYSFSLATHRTIPAATGG